MNLSELYASSDEEVNSIIEEQHDEACISKYGMLSNLYNYYV